jgi:hypothetical protein
MPQKYVVTDFWQESRGVGTLPRVTRSWNIAGLREVGTLPLMLIQRNVQERCRSEWGTRELRWALEPMTGLEASEHEFMCVSSSDAGIIEAISVYRRGDSAKKTLFEINVTGSHVGKVLCSTCVAVCQGQFAI